MVGVVDADTHIAESESMWNLMDANMYHRRPVLVSMPDDTLYKDWNALWLIDGNIFAKPLGKEASGSSLLQRRKFKPPERISVWHAEK